MTYQPPPPPPPPPAQPPGRPGVDPRGVNPLDWGILAAGVLALIFSTFGYYTVSVSFGGYSASASASAWHGFFGWFAALVALVGGALVGVELFAPQTKLPVPARLTGLGCFALATLCVILALFVYPGGHVSGAGVDEGHGVGYWLSLIVILAGLVMSLMRLQQQGGQLPGALGNLPNIGAYGPGGQGPQQHPYGQPGQTPPPPAGYAPPPPPPTGPPTQ